MFEPCSMSNSHMRNVVKQKNTCIYFGASPYTCTTEVIFFKKKNKINKYFCSHSDKSDFFFRAVFQPQYNLSVESFCINFSLCNQLYSLTLLMLLMKTFNLHPNKNKKCWKKSIWKLNFFSTFLATKYISHILVV